MAKPIVYTDAVHKQIRAAVDKGVAAGQTKTEMYAQLAPKYDITPAQVGKRYNNPPERLRALGRKYAKNAAGGRRVQGAPKVQGNVQVVSLEKAEGMIQIARQFGLATQVSITFLS